MFTSVVVVVVVVAAAAAILAIIIIILIIIKWCVLSEQCDYIYTNIISFPIKHHSLTSMEASLCLYTCPSLHFHSTLLFTYQVCRDCYVLHSDATENDDA